MSAFKQLPGVPQSLCPRESPGPPSHRATMSGPRCRMRRRDRAPLPRTSPPFGKGGGEVLAVPVQPLLDVLEPAFAALLVLMTTEKLLATLHQLGARVCGRLPLLLHRHMFRRGGCGALVLVLRRVHAPQRGRRKTYSFGACLLRDYPGRQGRRRSQGRLALRLHRRDRGVGRCVLTQPAPGALPSRILNRAVAAERPGSMQRGRWEPERLSARGGVGLEPSLQSASHGMHVFR